MNLYLSVLDYVRSASGVEVSSLVGNIFWLNAPVLAGAASFTIAPPLENALALYDRVAIFDGPQSEIVTVGAAVLPGQSSITLLGTTQYAHNANGVCCTDGVSGSLVDAIVSASTLLENICNQAQYRQSYTGEILRAPSLRASFDNQGVLNLRPKHFPLVSLDAIQISRTRSDATVYDLTQAFIDSDVQTVSMPALYPTGSGYGYPFSSRPPIARSDNAYITIGYTAGYLASALPADVKDACILLVSDVLIRRNNPGGYAQLTQGKTQIVGALRGDTSGESQLYKQAVARLSNYSVRAL